MILVQALPRAPSSYFEDIARAKRGVSREVLLGLREKMLVAFSRYQSAAPSLLALASVTLTKPEVDALQSTFSQKDLKAYRTLERDLKAGCRGLGLCCYCEIDTCSQLDHVLPFLNWPEYALCSINLVPSCSTCNQKKSKLFHGPAGRLFLHMHSELLPDERWLFAEVSGTHPDNASIEFELRPSPNVTGDLRKVLLTHYEQLGLLSRFAMRSGHILADSRCRVGTKWSEASELLDANSEEMFARYGKNYYMAAALKALSKRPELLRQASL